MSGAAGVARISAHDPANAAAVPASPLMPGKSGTATDTAVASAVTRSRVMGVKVAKNEVGDCNATPTTASSSCTSQ